MPFRDLQFLNESDRQEDLIKYAPNRMELFSKIYNIENSKNIFRNTKDFLNEWK